MCKAHEVFLEGICPAVTKVFIQIHLLLISGYVLMLLVINVNFLTQWHLSAKKLLLKDKLNSGFLDETPQ